jgi:hypothetical protein
MDARKTKRGKRPARRPSGAKPRGRHVALREAESILARFAEQARAALQEIGKPTGPIERPADLLEWARHAESVVASHWQAARDEIRAAVAKRARGSGASAPKKRLKRKTR